jgi:hypothetical protein
MAPKKEPAAEAMPADGDPAAHLRLKDSALADAALGTPARSMADS